MSQLDELKLNQAGVLNWLSFDTPKHLHAQERTI